MARCRNHTRSRHPKACARRPGAIATIHHHPSAGGTQHDRTYHPSHHRREVPARRGRRARGRGRPGPDRLRRPDQEGRRRAPSRRQHRRRALPATPSSRRRSRPGVIKVGTDTAYAPMESRQGRQDVGIDPDIAAALGKQLGVKFEFANGTLRHPDHRRCAPAATTSIMSAMTDTKAPPGRPGRQGQEDRRRRRLRRLLHRRRLDLHAEGQAQGHQDAGRPLRQDHRGAARHHLREASPSRRRRSARRRQEGLKIESFDTDAEAQTRVKSGGAEAGVNDSPVAAYIGEDLGRRQRLRAGRQAVEAAPVRHRGDKSEHPAERRAQQAAWTRSSRTASTRRSCRSGAPTAARSTRPRSTAAP